MRPPEFLQPSQIYGLVVESGHKDPLVTTTIDRLVAWDIKTSDQLTDISVDTLEKIFSSELPQPFIPGPTPLEYALNLRAIAKINQRHHSQSVF